jgi:anti-sigma regulatory factor (Ser/Thr protein kinase)
MARASTALSQSFDVDPYVYSLTLPRKLSGVAWARLTVRAALWDWHLEHLADAAQLVISGLAANAIRFATSAHAYIYLFDDGDPFESGRLVIEMVDDSQVLPEIVDACSGDERHRGLVLVAAYASAWGAELVQGGKMTWAHLDYRVAK